MKLKITSGEVLVGDPCYLGRYELSSIEMPNGEYNVNTVMLKLDALGGGEYVKELVLLAKGVKSNSMKWTKEFGISVDSGLAGFFDSDTEQLGDIYLDKWYDTHVCDMKGYASETLNSGAVVSLAGIGDGSYNVFVAEQNGVIVGVKIAYFSEKDVLYYNTPSLDTGRPLMLFHTTDMKNPIYVVPRTKHRFEAFIKSELKGTFGVVVLDADATTDIDTEIVQFKQPKDGAVAKLFKLSKTGKDIKLDDGDFVFTTSEYLGKCGGDLSKLLASPATTNNKALKYIRIPAKGGVYGMVVDLDKGKVVAIRVGKTN